MARRSKRKLPEHAEEERPSRAAPAETQNLQPQTQTQTLNGVQDELNTWADFPSCDEGLSGQTWPSLSAADFADAYSVLGSYNFDDLFSSFDNLDPPEIIPSERSSESKDQDGEIPCERSSENKNQDGEIPCERSSENKNQDGEIPCERSLDGKNHQDGEIPASESSLDDKNHQDEEIPASERSLDGKNHQDEEIPASDKSLVNRNQGEEIPSERSSKSKSQEEEEEEDDKQYFKKIPPGWKFAPTDREVIMYYLKPMLFGTKTPRTKIRPVNIYSYHPDDFAGLYEKCNDKHWIFFSRRRKKYAGGGRPARHARAGYWKATGLDTSIFSDNKLVGKRKTLVFYDGRPPDGSKTNWIMQEYTLKDAPFVGGKDEDGAVVMDSAVCKIYKNDREPKGKGKINDKQKRANPRGEGGAVLEEETGKEEDSTDSTDRVFSECYEELVRLHQRRDQYEMLNLGDEDYNRMRIESTRLLCSIGQRSTATRRKRHDVSGNMGDL